MTNQHIYPETQTRLAAELSSVVDRADELKQDVVSLKLILDQIASGGDFAALAVELGYSDAADAELAYNMLLAFVAGPLADFNYSNMTSRMG